MWIDEGRKRFIIQTEIERICFGSSGFVVEWVTHSSYDTAYERDKALARLLERGARCRAYDYSPRENRRIAF